MADINTDTFTPKERAIHDAVLIVKARATKATVEALNAKKYEAPLAYDQSIWNAAMNEAIAIVLDAAERAR